ncbi:hypothetical protein BsWGS_09683 [Bradybaena similaris]
MDNSDVASRHSVSRHPHSKRMSFLTQNVIWALEHYGKADQIDIVACYTALKQNKYICHCMAELDFYRDVLKLAKSGKFEVITGQHGEFIIKRHHEMFIKRLLRKGYEMLADVPLLCLQALGAVIALPVKLIRDRLCLRDNYSI